MNESKLQPLIDRQAIYDTLCRYCRGLERMDKDLAYSVWHEGGTALYHGMFEGSGHGFVDWVWEAHAAMERHSHQIANALIVVDGKAAKSETYVTVTLWTNPDQEGRLQEITVKGRYLDEWAERSGRWAISHREYVTDMQSMHDVDRDTVDEASQRNSSDPSFRLFPAHKESK